MKKFTTALILFAVFALILAGCGPKNASCDCKCKCDCMSVLAPEIDAEFQEIKQRLDALQKQCAACCKDGKCCCDTGKSPFAPQRLAALLDVADSFSKITAVYFAYAKPDADCRLDEAVGKAMKKALDEARDSINRSEVLFDVAYCEDMDRFEQIFRQMNKVYITDWHQGRVWIADLYTTFDEMIRSRIADLEGKESALVRMPLAAIPYAQRIKMNPSEYLEAHRKHWERTKKATKRQIQPGDKIDAMTFHRGQARLWWTDKDGDERITEMPVTLFDVLFSKNGDGE